MPVAGLLLAQAGRHQQERRRERGNGPRFFFSEIWHPFSRKIRSPISSTHERRRSRSFNVLKRLLNRHPRKQAACTSSAPFSTRSWPVGAGPRHGRLQVVSCFNVGSLVGDLCKRRLTMQQKDSSTVLSSFKTPPPHLAEHFYLEFFVVQSASCFGCYAYCGVVCVL